MNSVKVLHVSDLHLAEEAGLPPTPWESRRFGDVIDDLANGRSPNLFSQATYAVVAARALSTYCKHTFLREHPDGIVLVSGDLAATGEVRDLRKASGFLLGSIGGSLPRAHLNPNLGPLKHLVLMPGNHDRFWGRLGEPNCGNFELFFQGVWSPSSPCRRVSRFGPFGDQRDLVFLCADFSLFHQADADYPFGHFGQGRVKQGQLDALRDETNRCRDEGYAVVWVVHFPPAHPNVRKSLSLLNDVALLELATACRVNLVLSGHTHEQLLYLANDSVTIHCAGSATCQSGLKDWSFAELQICYDKGVVHSIDVSAVRYDSVAREFVASPPETSNL